MKSIFGSAFALALVLVPTFARADGEEQPPPLPPTQPAPSQATPSAQPPPADTTANASAEKPQRIIPIGIRADGGYSLRTLEKLPLTGADLGLAIGAQPNRHFAVWGETRLFIGSTENGLGVKGFRLNCDLDIVIDRFRITFDPGIFIVGINRATRDQTIVGWGPKLGVAARFDFVQTDAFALFARAGVEGGPTFSDGSLFGGATFGAGIDFDIRHGDRNLL